MISYHRRIFAGDKHGEARFYTHGFEVADTDDAARIARGVSRFVWTPGAYAQGHRAQRNFLYADWIGLDFDSGELSLSAAVENIFCDYVHVIGTTMSHQVAKDGLPPRDRFRVFLKMSERIEDMNLYRRQLSCVMDKWPCDTQCKDAARFFYPCRDIVSVSQDGEVWDVNRPSDEELRQDELWRVKMIEQQAARVRAHIIPPYVLAALKNPWPTGSRNTRCFRIGAALGTMGFTTADIVTMIVAGPTYSGSASSSLLREITETVQNGVDRGRADLAELERKQFPTSEVSAHGEE